VCFVSDHFTLYASVTACVQNESRFSTSIEYASDAMDLALITSACQRAKWEGRGLVKKRVSSSEVWYPVHNRRQEGAHGRF
jgi:hypothetical protein